MRTVALVVALGAVIAPASAGAAGGRVALTPGGDVAVVADDFAAAPVVVAPGGQDPAWSPDGARLAFSRGLPDANLEVAAPDGTGAHVVVDEAPGVDATQPAWTQDGASLVYTRASDKGRYELWIAPADGGAPPRRLLAGRRDSDARFVAGRLLFARDDELWAAHADGTAPRPLAVGEAAGALTPLPDGLSYILDGDGMTVLRPDGGPVARRLPGTANRSTLVVASDGRSALATHSGDHGALGTDLVDLTGAALPRQVAGTAKGARPLFGFRGLRGPAWWTPPPAVPVSPAVPARDVRPPLVLLAGFDGVARVLPAAGAGRPPVARLPDRASFPSLAAVDRTGVRSVRVRWRPGDGRWHDARTSGAFDRTVPRKAGTYRLDVRATDVLGHTTARPREAIVKLKG